MALFSLIGLPRPALGRARYLHQRTTASRVGQHIYRLRGAPTSAVPISILIPLHLIADGGADPPRDGTQQESITQGRSGTVLKDWGEDKDVSACLLFWHYSRIAREPAAASTPSFPVRTKMFMLA
ncbi:hypothetical protein DPSP01_000004 [Paraphaeosphaeria sporulosa]|uniref:Uncharacterized protein n=1 Tax=Paraphaeosphaeria sporulosa TaxID=1460663 RepID=A0A177D033_9PLEO|nr:uncharacterized protein CC84DRAFT_179696 [Paraphaeosphaeria sporulosa]OAG13075.1 hypothetical protein CC84DRAFT_179696 [Paraphaeosphaeria sporulosa]